MGSFVLGDNRTSESSSPESVHTHSQNRQDLLIWEGTASPWLASALTTLKNSLSLRKRKSDVGMEDAYGFMGMMGVGSRETKGTGDSSVDKASLKWITWWLISFNSVTLRAW